MDFCGGSLRPRSITSASCRGCRELVQSILTASVSVENITGIAFLLPCTRHVYCFCCSI
jgi:hypothetical protein